MKLFNVLLFSSLLLSGTELAAKENTRWQTAPDSSIGAWNTPTESE